MGLSKQKEIFYKKREAQRIAEHRQLVASRLLHWFMVERGRLARGWKWQE